MVSLAKPMVKNNSILLSPILLDINTLFYIKSDRIYYTFSRKHATVSTCEVIHVDYNLA